MRKTLLSLIGIMLLSITSMAQDKSANYGVFFGKARGVVADCIAGEQNVEESIEYGCAFDGPVVVRFTQQWQPPTQFCPPPQICPVYVIAPPPYDYVILASVTFDCQGNVISYTCDPVFVGGSTL